MSSPHTSPFQSVRSPLNDSTNSLRSRTPSPPPDISGPPQNKKLRRKASTISFRPGVGSSESIVSENSSIFDALSFHPSSESVMVRSPTAGTFVTGGRSSVAWLDHGIQDQQPQGHVTLQNPPLRTLHLPTQLETITEQRSIATLRPHRSVSLKRITSIRSQLSKLTSAKSLHATVGARRKQSFSLNDVELLHRYTRYFKTSSDESALRDLDEPTVPNQPVHLPPPRMPTPPGLPTFNTAAASNYRLPPPPTRFRDLFRLTRTPAELEWEAQTIGLPRGVIMRGENGILVRDKFRPGQSGHTGRSGSRPMGAIPLQRVLPPPFRNRSELPGSIIRVDGNRDNEPVLRSPARSSIHEREAIASGNPRLLNEGENVDSVPTDGGATTAPKQSTEGKESRWIEFWEDFCHCCCGAEKDEEGELHPQIVPYLSASASPGYARPLFARINCRL